MADRRRDHFNRRGLGNPYVVMPQRAGNNDPAAFSMNAAAGFPPDLDGWNLPPNDGLTPLDPGARRALSYDALVEKATMRPRQDFTVFAGVCTSWDKEARRVGRGTGFVGSAPRKYGAWLEHACRRALEITIADERVVFADARSGWAEGLGPDRGYGYAYVHQTAPVLNRLAHPARVKIPVTVSLGSEKRPPATPPQAIDGLIRAAARHGANATGALADALHQD